MHKRVVITGCGIVSSIGNNQTQVLESLIHNKSGIEAVPEWKEKGIKSHIAGTIKNVDTEEVRKKTGLKSKFMDDSSLYAVMAASQAVGDSGISQEILCSGRTACIVGSGVGSTQPVARAKQKFHDGSGKIFPYDIARGMSSSVSANLVNLFGITGRSYSISSACATSLHNIGHGCELIWNGRCDSVMAGGSEEVSLIITSMFDEMRSSISRAYVETPQKASRPYDSRRDGFVISGGAGIVILEEYQHAIERNAPIYAEVKGFGASSDGHDMIQPHPEGIGAYNCMKEALRQSDLAVTDIDYVNTHGTSTKLGDIVEAKAIERLFGDYRVPFSSTKSHTGHSIGAAGVHELIYCLLMMKHSFIAASINIEEPDPALEGMNIVRENRESRLSNIMTNSFGFGGTNASLIVGSV